MVLVLTSILKLVNGKNGKKHYFSFFGKRPTDDVGDSIGVPIKMFFINLTNQE